MLQISIEHVDKAYFLDFPQELSVDKYQLMDSFETKLQGIEIIDIIGQDHIQKTIEREANRKIYCVTRGNKRFPFFEKPEIIYFEGENQNLSSSEIRNKIKKRNFKDLSLHPEVLTYILENQLYL